MRETSVPGLIHVSGAGILWGTIGVGVQLVRRHDTLSPLTIGTYRLIVASILLLTATLVARRWGSLRTAYVQHRGRILAVGAGTAAFQVLYFFSVVDVGVSIATVITLGAAPLLLSVADAVRTRAFPAFAEALPVLAAVTGLVLVTAGSGQGTTGPDPLLGVGLGILSGAAYALSTVWGKRLTTSIDPLALTAGTTVAATLTVLPVAFVAGVAGDEPVVTADARAILVIVYLGAVTMALAYALLYAGLRTTSSGTALIATLLEPVVAALLAAALLDERVGPLGILGSLLILAAIATLGWRPQQRQALPA